MINIKNYDKLKNIMLKYQKTIDKLNDMNFLKEFISFSSQFDKYNFSDCISLFSQNDNITQVATYEMWQKLGCNISRGATGIPIIKRTANDNLVINYVFDKTDIIGNIPNPWTVGCDFSNIDYMNIADKILSKNIDYTKTTDQFSEDNLDFVIAKSFSLSICIIEKRLFNTDRFNYQCFENMDNMIILSTLKQAFNISRKTLKHIQTQILEEKQNDKLPTRTYKHKNIGRRLRLSVDGIYKRNQYKIIRRTLGKFQHDIKSKTKADTNRRSYISIRSRNTSTRPCISKLGKRYYSPSQTQTNDIYESRRNSDKPSDIRQISLTENIADIAGTTCPSYNFKLEYDSHISLGKKEKLANNITAIKLLQNLKDRTATADEQNILSKYLGFGGLHELFDKNNEKFKDEFNELKTLVSSDDYSMLKQSTLTSHYTPKVIIDNIYKILKNLGFKGGNILDPSMGIGNFYSLLPDNISENSKLYGCELDNTAGNISKHLYPNADIQITGFEEATFNDNFFDVIISNIPFGNYNIHNEKHSALIHDFFFLNSIDKLKPGGIIAFVTSTGTLDKSNFSIRSKISRQADLLAAVRLPNNVFKQIADASVTTDIIFLQKRFDINTQEPDWVYTGNVSDILNDTGAENDIAINQYFIDNPHMILGNLTLTNSQYGRLISIVKPNNLSLDENFNNALPYIKGKINTSEYVLNTNTNIIPSNNSMANFTFNIVNDSVYFKENDILINQNLNDTKTDKIKLYLDIKQHLQHLLSSQLNGEYNPSLHEPLNKSYDIFVKKHGHINNKSNSSLLKKDINFYLVASIENNIENKYIKGDIFYKQTIKQKPIIDKAETALDALNISLSSDGYVNLELIKKLFPCDDILSELKGEIFLDPDNIDNYIYKEEYLSGNTRQKLIKATEVSKTNPTFSENVIALKDVQPKWLEATDISIRLSSHWIDEVYINQFIYDICMIESKEDSNIKATYSKLDNVWKISNKHQIRNFNINSKFGTDRINALSIIEQTLNQKKLTIKDPVIEDGRTHYIYNHKETILARGKQENIEIYFKDWIYKCPERRQDLVEYYNNTFNNITPRHYNGANLTLPGTCENIKLDNHQLNAVARIRSSDSTLLAHIVGAGKTYSLLAGGMERLRLGKSTKLMYTVPNHIIEQFSQAFIKLYPSANILVATKKDFEPKNRKKFVSKIATSDIDAVILGHSQFEKINISPERRQKELQIELYAIESAVSSLDANTDNRTTIKQLENKKMKVLDKMKMLLSATSKDEGIIFEELGVDALFVDEAHYFKNGAIFSKMQNIAGIGNSSSAKASDMLAKVRYLREKGGCVTFATGTPVSNSISELYIMQRYLQEDMLNGMDIFHFDEWASIFAETENSIELKPEGSGFQSKTRFTKFFNLPELKNIFSTIADIKSASDLNLPTPKLFNNAPKIISCTPNQDLHNFMKESVTRAENIRNSLVNPYEDNMLKLTSDARKAGLDMRLYDNTYDFYAYGKIAKCSENIYSHYINSRDNLSTQLVFSDIGTPGAEFNVYDELKRLLVEKGIPTDEIAFIHDAKTEIARDELFESMINGTKSILIGSTLKCGAGTNIQKRLLALHHLDCPWRPSDIQQREGRILRQGNDNEMVYIYRYVTEKSFDAYMWQTLENKQKFVSQITNLNDTSRQCGDIDEAILSFAEIKSIASGNPLVREKMEIESKINKLTLLKNEFKRTFFKNQDLYTTILPKQLINFKDIENKISKDLTIKKQESFSIKLEGITYINRSDAAKSLDKIISTYKIGKGCVDIGEYNSFKLTYNFDNISGNNSFSIVNEHKYTVESGHSSLGNITRIENIMDNIKTKFEQIKRDIKDIENKISALKDNINNTTFKEDETLRLLKNRLSEINTQIDFDSKETNTLHSVIQNDIEI